MRRNHVKTLKNDAKSLKIVKNQRKSKKINGNHCLGLPDPLQILPKHWKSLFFLRKSFQNLGNPRNSFQDLPHRLRICDLNMMQISKRPKTSPKTVQKRAPPPGMRHLKTREVLALIRAPFPLQNSGRLRYSGSLVLRTSGSQALRFSGILVFCHLPEETGRSFIGHKSAPSQKKSFWSGFCRYLLTLPPPTNFPFFESPSSYEVTAIEIY